MAPATKGPRTVTRRQDPLSEESSSRRGVQDLRFAASDVAVLTWPRRVQGLGHIAICCDQGNGQWRAVAPKATPLEN